MRINLLLVKDVLAHAVKQCEKNPDFMSSDTDHACRQFVYLIDDVYRQGYKDGVEATNGDIVRLQERVNSLEEALNDMAEQED